MTTPDQPYTDADVQALAAVLSDTFLERSLDCWPDFEREARAALDHLAARFVAEGRCQATDGWDRRWSVRDQHGHVSKSGFTEAGARQRAVETGGTFVTRLVGPWEATGEAKPTCTCPMLDVTNIREDGGEGIRTFQQGWDPNCPACTKRRTGQAGGDRGQG